MHSAPRAACRIAGFFLSCLFMVPALAVTRRMKNSWRSRLPCAFYRYLWRLFGVRVAAFGERHHDGATLFVVNHTSYFDILVLGGLIPGCFVAKSEIRRWPFFGMMSRLGRTIFVDRRPRAAAGQRDAMSDRLLAGENVILFPEGTSDDGYEVLPFKSALFAAAQVEEGVGHVHVQPVSLTYTRLDGVPLGRHLRPLVSWYGDMNLLPHCWTALGMGNITVEVEFHAPLTIDDTGSRKELAETCRAAVAAGVSRALSGRRDGHGAATAGRRGATDPSAVASALPRVRAPVA